MTYNWNLTVERKVLPEWLVRAAYVGSASNYLRVVKHRQNHHHSPECGRSADYFVALLLWEQL